MSEEIKNEQLKQGAGSDELSEKDLEQVAGGGSIQDVTVNKAKTADKAAAAMDAYIRS